MKTPDVVRWLSLSVCPVFEVSFNYEYADADTRIVISTVKSHIKLSGNIRRCRRLQP
jgi:hypothetical protein